MSNGRNVAARPQPPTKAAAEAWLREKGFSAARVNKAKTKDLAAMVCELHGVSADEYQAGKRKTR